MNFKRSISALMSVLIVFSVIIPMPVLAAGNPAITISSVTDTPGSTVNVELKIKDNPGILGAELEITFDEGLTLIGASNGDAFSPLTMTKPGKLTSPCKFVWDGQELADSDVKDGTILTLQFTLPENAEKGTKYNISAAYDDGAVVNRYLVPVFPDITNGYIEVLDYVYGDLNEDKKVNTTDVIMLRRHLAGGYEQTINIDAADVNTDTKKNTTDVILMRRFIAGGYGITFPYIIEGCNHVLQAFAAKEATYTEPGNIAYWQCRACKKYFADEIGETEITVDQTILPVLAKEEYTIQYMCEMVAPGDTTFKESDTYKPSQGKVLQIPKMDTYKFLGWSDKDGKMYGTELPVGTTGDLILYANWASNRNKAVPVKNLEDPIICEDSENGQILFVYEIGKIENIPIFETQDLLVVNGLITSNGVVKQTSIAKGNAETIGETVAKATTNSSTWTLSKDWEETVSVSEEWAKEEGVDLTKGNEFCKSSSNTFNVTNTSGGTNITVDEEGNSYKVSANKGHDVSASTENQNYVGYNIDGKISNSTVSSLGLNAGIKIPLSGKKEANVGGEAGISNNRAWEIGGGVDVNGYTKNTITGTANWDSGIESAGSESTINTEEKNWNCSAGYSSSNSYGSTESISKTISSLISNTHSEDSSYSTGGSTGESQGVSYSNESNNSYSSSVSYSEEEINILERKFESTGKTYGAYRLVQTGMARVFAIVGYDIKNKTYYVSTHSVLDDDESNYKEYLDYSFDRTFTDYETSVLSFEIPFFVNQYVNSRIASSKLRISDDGIVTKYLGAEEDKVVLIPSYYTRTNATTGEPEMIKIKGIAPGLFKNNTNIVGVSLGNFVNEIPESAFEGCTALKEIVCPNVVRIGANAFKGCTSLSEFSLPDEIESIGDNAFDGIPALKSIAPTKEIANIVANSNAKNITLDISKIEADDFSDMSFDIGEINSFKLLGGYKEYKGLNINSDASTTILSGITIPESNVTPIELSSSNVTLERVSIHSDTFCLILKADTTKISIEGISNIISESGDGILSKNIEFSLINEETDSAIDTDSNVMVCGTVSNNDDYLNENHIIYITEDEYTNYLTQRKVTFDANGGVLGTETNYVIVPYNGVIGEFPVASRDYYTFDGWYTEAEGGEAVTSETNISSDTTFYAHWVHNDAVWALASEAPEDAEIVNKKYKYTLTSYTTSSSSSLSGWEKYDVKWKWSSYGSWSSWSTKAVTETDAKDVETKSVVSGYKKKTQWLYSRARSPRGSVAYGWVSGDCTVVEGTGWLDSPLEHQATHSCGNAYGKGFRNEDGVVYSGIYWYNETTQTVDDLNSPIYQTQYRYRTRSKVYTYYYEKDETKESATYPTAPSGCDISNIQEWVQYRAK